MTDQPLKILYVDDEPLLLDIAQKYLARLSGYVVSTCESADQALVMLDEESFDAIISDYQMPVIDGIGLLKEVRSRGITIPFILFTGKGREEVVIQALNEGADYYLQKGGEIKSQFAELSDKIQKAITQRTLEHEVQNLKQLESDIINFLPDPTMAITADGKIIAWNQAMQTLTGVMTEDILGKGNYEYSLPFYGERRQMLIDIVLTHDPETIARYPVIRREGDRYYAEITLPRFRGGKDTSFWFSASPLYDTAGNKIGAIESIRDITDRKNLEDALEKRILALTTPLDRTVEVTFDEVFDITSIQRLQDVFAATCGVASIITRPDGTPITHPSNFTRLCHDIIRKTEKGYANCLRSDAIIGGNNAICPTIQPCMSGGLWDAGVPIMAGNQQIGNWLIGQVRDTSQTEEKMREYARIIGADEELVVQAFHEVPSMSQEQFTRIADMLHTIAHQISTIAYQNIHQARLINDLKETKDALKMSQERLSLTISAVNDGIWDWNVQTGDAYFSPQWYTMLGYEPGEMPASYATWRSLIHPDDISQTEAKIQDHITQNIPRYTVEFRMRTKEGSWKHILARGQIVEYDTSDLPVRMVGTHTDITELRLAQTELEQKNAELESSLEELATSEEELRIQFDELTHAQEELKASEEQFHHLFESMSEGMVLHELIWNAEGEPVDYLILEANISFERILGIPRDSVIGKRATIAYGVQEAPYLEQYAKVAITGIPDTFETYFPPLDRFFKISVYSPDKNRFATVFEDITERKKTEDTLRKANKNLQLLSSITRHDILNKVMILQNYGELMEEMNSDPELAESITHMKDAADAIKKQIEFTREYDKLGIRDPSWISITSLIERLSNSPIPITCTCTGIELFADPMLGKVFENLLDNVLRHAGTATRILIRCKGTDDGMVVCWEDDGPGVMDTQKEKIFERGYGKNTGFGLFLIREILSITGLSITETGIYGHGAKFEIYAPKGMWKQEE